MHVSCLLLPLLTVPSYPPPPLPLPWVTASIPGTPGKNSIKLFVGNPVGLIIIYIYPMHFISSSTDIASHVSWISIFQNSKKSMKWLRFMCKYFILKQKANFGATLELRDWFVSAYYSNYIKRKGYGNLNNLCTIFIITYWLLITELLAWFAADASWKNYGGLWKEQKKRDCWPWEQQTYI